MTAIDLTTILRHAVAAHEAGRIGEAIAAYRRVIAINPAAGEVYNNCATGLLDLARPEEALTTYRRAALTRNAYARPFIGAGATLQALGRHDAARAPYRVALALDPGMGAVLFNLGVNLQQAGMAEEASRCFRHAAVLMPGDDAVLSQHLFTLNYLDLPGEALLEEHRAFARRPRSIGGPFHFDARADRDRPGGRLRIGYVSVEFRRHLGESFLSPVFDHHDRASFELYCYSMVEPRWADDHTARFRERADHWRDVAGMSDAALAQRIHADGIDVLVDLAGHTMLNRLGVFSARPAPVQLTWLGYANTTGLSTIDARLVDAFTDPPGRSETHASETLLRLPPPFLCFRPPENLPDVVPLPAGRVGAVTFGSFNTLAKLSPDTLALWVEILRRTPGSRLLIKDRVFGCSDVAERFRRRLAGMGLAPERVELIGWLDDPTDHAALYGRVDIALDPFPYNGTITTCEALWMGAPVVVLRGARHAARVGTSLCAAIGLPELIADTPARYIDIAVGLALNLNRLMELRVGMRDRMRASPLCDAPRFVADLEDAYRVSWRRWRDGSAR